MTAHLEQAATSTVAPAPGAADAPERNNFHAGLLLQLVEDLHVSFTYERSFRVCREALLTNRFLLTIDRESVPTETILALCRRLAMPEVLVEVAGQKLDAARFVHFGFEENESTALYKVYLEFPWATDDPRLRSAGPLLLHLAFKWDIADNSRHVQTQYLWYPGIDVPQIAGRLADLYGHGTPEGSWEIAHGVLQLAAGRPVEQTSYLEVTEDTNGRRSFDLNMYDVNLRVADLEPFLAKMCRHFSIPVAAFRELYERIKDRRFGHLAGGVHRNGQEFFNVYYGAERRQPRPHTRRVGWPTNNMKRLEYTTEQDQYYNYCWWPYLPVAATDNKFRPANLLAHSFRVAGLDERADRLVDLIQKDIGMFRTVWGAKWLPESPYPSAGESPVTGRLAWEFYFYDYQRRERTVSISRLLKTIRPIIRCDVPVNEELAYFMFSLDVNAELTSGQRPLDVVHMYIGNPGSKVSSGIAYALRAEGTTLENFYFFFDAHRDLREAAEKIYCSAHVDLAKVGIDRLLIPELRDCHTICVANKQKNDTVYFSGVNVAQLLFFLKWLRYPPEIIGFVEENRGKLDHLLYDVGFDYVANGGEVEIVKSGYYGVF